MVKVKLSIQNDRVPLYGVYNGIPKWKIDRAMLIIITVLCLWFGFAIAETLYVLSTNNICTILAK